MKRVLSILAHYSPIFGDLNRVPGLVFPFVKLFQSDECLALEVVISFFLNWGQLIFEDFPQAPTRAARFVSDIDC